MLEACIFDVSGVRAAIPAALVRAIVPLPELSRVPEVPPYFAGAFELRGRAVPVISSFARMSEEPRGPRISDQVIVLEHAGDLVGLLVEEVVDVASLAPTDVEPPLAHAHRAARFVVGVGKLEGMLVTIVDIERLIAVAEALGETASGPDAAFTAEEAAILRERAQRLAREIVLEGTEGDEVVLVEIGGEALALDPTRIREFTVLRRFTPVPGAPAHILGLANLRGRIVTIVDLRPLLGLRMDDAKVATVCIIDTPEGAIGLALANARDLARVARTQAGPSEAARPYLTPAATSDGANVSLLDLDHLIGSGILIVDQEASS